MADEAPKEGMRDWIRERPKAVQKLMLEFPPLARVRTVPGVVLRFPAPGIIGSVQSWTGDGWIGVVAPSQVTETSPITGYTIVKGELVRGQCQMSDLELVECLRLGTGELVDHDFIRDTIRADGR